MFKTRITELLGVEYPIQCGTMMNLSNAPFVSACANAGIFTCLASANFPDEQSLVDEINKLNDMTDKPYGVNVSLFPGHDARSAEVTLDILAKHGAKIIETAGRSPQAHLEKIRAMGAIHLHKCARLRDAVKVDKLGVNIVSLVGAECGGHPGMEDVSTLVLIPEATSQVGAPMLAGGGFTDGKSLVAALALGAEGVIMGSRFLNTEECPIHQNIKDKMIAAEMTDTMVIQKSIGSAIRVLKNKWAQEIEALENRGASLDELLPYITSQKAATAWRDGGDDAVFPCGQVIGRTKETLTVKELVQKIMTEAKDVSKRIETIANA
jgi:NAD(P)H-dependent flavin oxidoreductase YrpB (nitropropane dioxygenase family)